MNWWATAVLFLLLVPLAWFSADIVVAVLVRVITGRWGGGKGDE